MDRDKRWERVKVGYDLLVSGKGEAFESMHAAMEASYAADVTDEFIKPIVHVRDGKPLATIEEGDAVIFFNYRTTAPKRSRLLSRNRTCRNRAWRPSRVCTTAA